MAGAKRKRRGRTVRLRREEAIAVGSALALFALLFFPWYDVSLTQSNLSLPDTSGAERTAWESLEVVAPLLALAVVLTLGVVLARLLNPDWRPLIVPGAVICLFGGLATLLVLFRVLISPELDGLIGIEYETTPSLGAFLGLVAAFGVALGGYRAMRAEGSSFAAVADSLQPEPRQREKRGREGKDAGSPPKRAH